MFIPSFDIPFFLSSSTNNEISFIPISASSLRSSNRLTLEEVLRECEGREMRYPKGVFDYEEKLWREK